MTDPGVTNPAAKCQETGATLTRACGPTSPTQAGEVPRPKLGVSHRLIRRESPMQSYR